MQRTLETLVLVIPIEMPGLSYAIDIQSRLLESGSKGKLSHEQAQLRGVAEVIDARIFDGREAREVVAGIAAAMQGRYPHSPS